MSNIKLPATLVGFERYEDTLSFSKLLARYRRHDHGGGENGDDWLSDFEIEKDFNEGKKKFQAELDRVNAELKKNGFVPNAEFYLGEKGHFSIEINPLTKKK